MLRCAVCERNARVIGRVTAAASAALLLIEHRQHLSHAGGEVRLLHLPRHDRRARRAEKRKTDYWARRDIAIGTVGVSFDF